MKRKKRWLLAGAALLALFGGAAAILGFSRPEMAVYESGSGISMKFKASGPRFVQYRENEEPGWHDMFVKGVNLGATVPGYFPGELPATEEDYLRWFQQIDEMGANVIRVYTIHQPLFYSALVKYNEERPEDPLYFMQGIWSPEEQLIEEQDAYAEHIHQAFKQEIGKAVGAVYGDITIEPSPGAASGTYTDNAGPYLMAWHIGTEWDPAMVKNTNEKHSDVPLYQGDYFAATEEASPFESWLAGIVDHTAAQEIKYGWQHPMAFTNWVTTDVLEHPGEPLFEEDMVSVDARHVEPVNWEAGYFAAFHVYPYYPDFFRTDKTLQTIEDGEGGFNTYRAYLRRLKQEIKELPVMITEYGVPSSKGLSHHGPGGRDQGGHNEQEQGEINVSLTRDIYEEGYAGAILFMWQDEWFKKTWNTMPLELPADRRAYWLNVLTNEKMFGVLAMEPGKASLLHVDGSLGDWDQLGEGEAVEWISPSSGVQRMKVTHDEAYLYVGLELDRSFDPLQHTLWIGADTQAGGDIPVKELDGRSLIGGKLETLIQLAGDEDSQVKIAPSYNFHKRLYGKEGYWMLPEEELKAKEPLSFDPWKLGISLMMSPPDTRFAHPFVDEVVGDLKRGSSNPDNPDFDSLAAWQYKEQVLELRIPWMLLGFADPSSHQAIDYSPMESRRAFPTSAVEGITLIPWLQDRGAGKATKPKDSSGEVLDVKSVSPYVWKGWEGVDVKYSERLKQSYAAMQAYFTSVPDIYPNANPE
ncbi:hypothetical protein ACH6EH_18540 [Paenibacillus sp. JSM ZJ436]|uniref:hypothetical protein n=1 Tax=Paenibacillus sp. JSM ZJ436 TaxID=3376190 RepID=UPI0037902388